jgi:hypothetical protein
MVCLSALNDYGTHVAQYFMIDAAVAIEALDNGVSADTNMIYPYWQAYTNRVYASRWFALFPASDARSTLNWSGRFGTMPVTNLYNFYSSGEEVLREYTGGLPPTDLISSAPYQVEALIAGAQGSFAWAWQELAKGVAGFDDLLGSTHGGWRFNSQWDTNVFGGHLSPPHAAQIPASALQTNAFFDFNSNKGPWPDGALETSVGPQYAQAHRYSILANAIPAVTLPVGANTVTNLNIRAGATRNFNMQTLYENGWPADRMENLNETNNWHHSDFRQVPYTFTYRLFTNFVSTANIK